MTSKIWSQVLIVFFIAVIFTVPLTALFSSSLHVETDIFALLPQDDKNIVKEEAFNKVSREAARKVIILFANSNKESAYKAAVHFYQKIRNADYITEKNFLIDNSYKEDLSNWYANYRYHLLSPEYYEMLKTEKGIKIKDAALRNIYSPASSAGFVKVTEDPFLLFDNFFASLPFSRSALMPYKSVLMAEYNKKNYVFMSLTLSSDAAFSVSKLNKIIADFDIYKDEAIINNPGTEYIISGIPAHSAAISKRSMKEANVIAAVSIIFTVLLVLYVFGSLKPLFLSLFSIGAGFLWAFAFTHFIFKEIHFITIVFGVSLIGIAVDYSFHFFAEYFSKEPQTGKGILQRLFPSLSIALITTLLGYAALAVTPFPVLRQIACFAVIGLTMSFIVVIFLYPKFYQPKQLKRAEFLCNFADDFLDIFVRFIQNRKIVYSAVFILSLLMAGIFAVKGNDDIRSLSSSPQYLLDNEKLTREVLRKNTAPQFFLITGENQQELLEREERIGVELNKLVKSDNLSSYLAISQMVPSIKKQKENYELIKKQLLEPHLINQSVSIGLSGQSVYRLNEFFEDSKNLYITPDEAIKHKSALLIKPLYLGKVDNVFASVIMLDGVKTMENISVLANENSGVYFMDKIEDVSGILKKYRYICTISLLVTCILLLILLCFRYGLMLGALVAAPPFVASILSIAMLFYFGKEVNLFHILSLFFVIGIGIDYTIYYADAKNHRNSATIAIFLSFVTTILSFGLLTFSNFGVLSSFGFVALFGIFFVYILAPVAAVFGVKKE